MVYVNRESDRMIPQSSRFTLDGESVNIGDFIEENGFFTLEIQQIASLEVGEAITYGGGAAPVFVLRRVA